MLRIYFLQQWFNLSDPAVEEALYDSVVMRSFVGIDLGREPVPDETTVCKLRHLLEEHGLGGEMLETVNLHLENQGVRITTGTIVDATIIHAPSSPKNREQKRNPEMHQTKKGKQWYFGMKAHVGVDSKTKLIHTALVTPANVADARHQHNVWPIEATSRGEGCFSDAVRSIPTLRCNNTSFERMSHMPLGEMGERGRRWMEEEFAWETVAQEMLRLYGKLLLKGQSTP